MKKLCFFLVGTLLLSLIVKAQIPCNTWLSTPSQPSYVNIGNLNLSDPFTVEAVFYRTSFFPFGSPHSGYLVSKMTVNGNAQNINYLLRPDAAIITYDSGQVLIAQDSCPYYLNKIYHVAMTFDGAQLRFYRNGYLKAVAYTPSGSLNIIDQNSANAMIGYHAQQSLNQNFIGNINEVRIWNTVRNQSEIQQYMATTLPSPGSQTGLVSYYHFNSLTNQQGNTTWDGSLTNSPNAGSNASINSSVPNCTFNATDSCGEDSTIVMGPNCSDTCYWKVTGNNILNGNNIFGTLSNDDINVYTSGTQRGVLKNDGAFGWNTTSPSTTFHVDCSLLGASLEPSGLRFENLPSRDGYHLVVDDAGYVYKTDSRAIQERELEFVKLQEEVESLKRQLFELKQAISKNIVFPISQNVLEQNRPNPASAGTTIKCYISEYKTSASIVIYDLSGKELMKFKMDKKGKNEIEIKQGMLSDGMYLYSLIIDGAEVDTKRMMLSK